MESKPEESSQYNCDYCDTQVKEESKIQEITEQFDNSMKIKSLPFKKAVLNPIKERIGIAPMVDVTDNYFRHFTRSLTKHAFLYTEMLNEHAILHIQKTNN